MKRTITACMCAFVLAASLVCFGCSSGTASSSSASASASAAASAASASTQAPSTAVPENGTYIAEIKTDSSMFHVNESKDDKGELTVADGKMTVHMTLASTRIVNLYVGTADQAKSDPSGVIQPTTDKVTYSDGTEEEVYGFDVPVPALGQEFAVAILGEKGTWYDHKVTVSNPVKE